MQGNVAQLKPVTDSPDDATFVRRAVELVPVLRDRSARTNAERRVPDETIDDFRAAGFFRLLQPRMFGGYEADYGVFTRVLEELARGCGSSAWVCAVLGEHPWLGSCFGEQAQRDIWDANPDARISASFSPKPVTRVDGGYRATGTWSFSSGCDHADWLYLGAMTDDGMIFMLVPSTDIAIIDDWHVLGLRGTGSKSLKLVDVFVPEHRTMAAMTMFIGPRPGEAVHPDSYLPRASQMMLAPYSLPSVTLGLAQRALDHFVATTAAQMIPGAGPAAEQQHLQYEVAIAKSEIDMVRLLMRDRVRQGVEASRARAPVDMLTMFEGRRDLHVATHKLVAVILRLCGLSNARWVMESDPMQLILRDAVTASAHRGAMFDSTLMAGRHMVGLPPVQTFIPQAPARAA